MGTFSTDFASSSIKSIQRGESLAIASGSTITISSVTTSKSVVVCNSSGGSVFLYGYVKLTSSTQLTYFNNGAGNGDIAWQVVEYN